MIKEKSRTWDAISRWLGRTFDHLPIGCGVYTWLTLPAALAGFALIRFGRLGAGVSLFALSGLLDLVDGAVARHRGETSALGAFLDGSLDRFVDFLLLFSYFWIALELPWLGVGPWLALALFFVLMPTFEVAYANHRRAVDDPEETILWRILHRGEMYPFMLAIPLVSSFDPALAGWLLVLLVALSAVTTAQTFVATIYHSRR